MKKNYKRSYNEIWHERKRTVVSMLVLFAVVMVAIMGVRAVLDYIDFNRIKDIFNAPQETHKYETMHNASRYFFRIYYPDDKWKVEGELHGFMLDDSSGLVAIMYPLIYEDPATPGPDADPAATSAVSFEKVRDYSALCQFRYKKYTPEMLERANGAGSAALPEATENPSASPTSATSSAATVKTDTPLLDVSAEAVYQEYKAQYGAYYKISDLKTYKTERYGYNFKWFSCSYSGSSGTAFMTDVFVIARSTNYIVITFEANGLSSDGITPDSYLKYRDSFLDVLNEFQLSVFED